MDDRLRTTLALAVGALLVGATLGAAAAGVFQPPLGLTDGDPGGPQPQWSNDELGFRTFESTAAFQAYFAAASEADSIGFVAGGQPVTTRAVEEAVAEQATAAGGDGGGDGGAAGGSAAGGEDVPRHSTTNVQVTGIDEPDVLKTDGQSVYYAGFHFQRGAHETSVLSLDTPSSPEVAASIPAAGELLLVEATDTLVVFEHERIWGFDVSDPSQPEQAWDVRLDAELQTARLANGSIYLVLVDRPNRGDSCPIRPYDDVQIDCTAVYRPDAQADADAVYTAARVDPATGELVDTTSVVGSVRDSATYVSEEAIYLTYTRSTAEYDLMTRYLTGPGADHLNVATVERLETLESLDISPRAKTIELHVIMENWFDSLPDDERRDAQRDLAEGLSAYAEDHQRDLTKTGIVRISIDGDLDVTAVGEVPGYPLNQWSMDEHEDHLRIATTIPGVHGADSENDVYVLDSNLTTTGTVEGLGETERIYAVRFQGDQGYVVTFRQIDPFYTLDLSDPEHPRVEGELKIPGFSTYLHPLDDEDDLVLGVGQEDRKLKLSIFDVSDREHPEELDVIVFEDEHYSEAVQNHRAFLHDERHGVFFLPAGESSYVFSYAGGEFTEEARIDAGGPGVRGLYVGDSLYVFGPEQVVVLNQTTWAIETRVDVR